MRPKRAACLVLLIPLIWLAVSARAGLGQADLKILLSNDDGIDAPGLAALFEKLAPLGTVTVAASTKNLSGVSHSIAPEGPIWVSETERKGQKWYSIEAPPASCVRLALESLLPEKPDIVIAGINKGDSTGVVTYYSATVACAREAAFAGLPAIAVHLERGATMDYEAAASFIADLVRGMKRKGLRQKVFLNINIPNPPQGGIRGVQLVKQDTRATLEFYEKKIDPSGKLYFLRSFKHLEPAGEKTDIWALRNGYISITPLQIDGTNKAALKALKSWDIPRWKK